MSIDEILDKYAMAHYAFMEDVMSEGETIEQQKDQAKQALYKDMVELIEDNIIYGNEQISKDELLEAVRKYYGVEE